MNRLPTPLVTRWYGAQTTKLDLQASNVAGPPVHRLHGGSEDRAAVPVRAAARLRRDGDAALARRHVLHRHQLRPGGRDRAGAVLRSALQEGLDEVLAALERAGQRWAPALSSVSSGRDRAPDSPAIRVSSQRPRRVHVRSSGSAEHRDVDRALADERRLPLHISSPALRITIGTIGTPACMAMWKAPFLKRPSRGVGLRVPSGAMAIETPSRSFSTTGASASLRLLRVAAVDVGHVDQERRSGRSAGRARPPSSRRRSSRGARARPSTGMSIELWWLKMKTAGRC